MDFITSKFGAMYCENEEGEFELYDVFLAEYNLKNDRFLISSGPSRGVNSGAFNLVKSKPEEFFKDCSKVDFEEYFDDCDIAILFDDDYIEKVKCQNNFESDLDTFTYLSNELSKIKIHKNPDYSFFTKKFDGNIIYTDKDIYDICFNEDNILSSDEFEKFAPYGLDLNGAFLQDEKVEEMSPIDFMASLIGMPRIITIGSGQFMPNLGQEKSYEELKKEVEVLKKKVQEERDKQLEKKKINTKTVIESTSNKIVGQEEVIRTLVNQIYNNQMIINELSKEEKLNITELDARKATILLDGETGTGKTAIIKDICAQLELPVTVASATSFSSTGYIGASVTDLLEDLLKQADGNVEKAERGIIVFDEIDKLAFDKSGVLGKDMREGVQHELLSFIGGGEYEITLGDGIFGERKKFNTSKITFILSGAFTDLREEKIKEVDGAHQAMGFSTLSSENYDKEYMVTPDDYIKFGLMREFFGRIKVLTSTKSYNLEDCKKILLESTVSPLLDVEKTVKMYGYPGISYDEEFLNRVIEEGMKMKTGARGLQTVMHGIKNNMLNGLINNEFDLDKPIELNTGLVDDYKKSFIRKY